MDEKQKLLKGAPKQVQQAYATMVANAEQWLRSELPGDSAGAPCVNTEAHAHCEVYHSDDLGWILQDLKQACYGGGGICLHPKDGNFISGYLCSGPALCSPPPQSPLQLLGALLAITETIYYNLRQLTLWLAGLT